jgi:nitrogen-specific signal transduction histidine kinase
MNCLPEFIVETLKNNLQDGKCQPGKEVMGANTMADGPRVDGVTLVICDAAGRVQAVTSNASKDVISCSPIKHKHFAEVFGQDSEITRWLTYHMNEARRQGEYYNESQLENGSNPSIIKLESLKCDEEFYGFVLTISPLVARDNGDNHEEGDAVIYRKQWHEIKNHIGALKLYATFLTKKLPEGDERQAVEKMLSGINTLIEYLARIRRGEAQ